MKESIAHTPTKVVFSPEGMFAMSSKQMTSLRKHWDKLMTAKCVLLIEFFYFSHFCYIMYKVQGADLNADLQ